MNSSVARRFPGGRLRFLPRRAVLGLADPVHRPQLGVAVGCAGAVGVVALVDPVTTHIPLCPLHEMTGLDCPFCGSLRAVFELTRGNLASAAHDNILLVTLLPIVVILWFEGIWRRGTERGARRWPRSVKLGLVVGAVGFGVVRNLPGFRAWRPLG
jgi:hypothetical protein